MATAAWARQRSPPLLTRHVPELVLEPFSQRPASLCARAPGSVHSHVQLTGSIAKLPLSLMSTTPDEVARSYVVTLGKWRLGLDAPLRTK